MQIEAKTPVKSAAFKGPWCWGCGCKIEGYPEELAAHKADDGKHYCDYSCKPENIAWTQAA